MATTLRPRQMIQLQSFWNLIQASDESVQKELYVLLQHKYSDDSKAVATTDVPSFLQLKGILKGSGSYNTDREMLDEYLAEKYDR